MRRWLIILTIILITPNVMADDKETKVLLGLTVDQSGSIVAANPQIEYLYPGIEKIKMDKLLRLVKYLPPYAINYEDRITEKQRPTDDMSIHDIFKIAFIKYGPKYERGCDQILLVARQVLSDSRPLISVWWFTYIKEEELRK